MKRLVSVFAMLVSSAPGLALAEGAGGGYRGIAQMYYTLMAVVLIYGVYDTFGKKAMYVAGPVIAIVLYLMLPEH